MKKNVLFVCTGNSCRSVMAEGLFKKAVEGRQDQYVVGSAGVAAMDGYPSTLETIRALKRQGVDMSGHRSRRLTREMVRLADKIFVMERLHKSMILEAWPEAGEKVHLLTEFSESRPSSDQAQDVPDPIRGTDEYYNGILEIVNRCIERIVKEV